MAIQSGQGRLGHRIVCTSGLFSLFYIVSSTATADEVHKRLAFSERLGIEVYVGSATSTKPWCRENVDIEFRARNADFYKRKNFLALVPKIGVILNKECPRANAAVISGVVNDNGQTIVNGTASKGENWHFIQSTFARVKPPEVPRPPANNTGKATRLERRAGGKVDASSADSNNSGSAKEVKHPLMSTDRVAVHAVSKTGEEWCSKIVSVRIVTDVPPSFDFDDKALVSRTTQDLGEIFSRKCPEATFALIQGRYASSKVKVSYHGAASSFASWNSIDIEKTNLYRRNSVESIYASVLNVPMARSGNYCVPDIFLKIEARISSYFGSDTHRKFVSELISSLTSTCAELRSITFLGQLEGSPNWLWLAGATNSTQWALKEIFPMGDKAVEPAELNVTSVNAFLPDYLANFIDQSPLCQGRGLGMSYSESRFAPRNAQFAQDFANFIVEQFLVPHHPMPEITKLWARMREKDAILPNAVKVVFADGKKDQFYKDLALSHLTSIMVMREIVVLSETMTYDPRVYLERRLKGMAKRGFGVKGTRSREEYAEFFMTAFTDYRDQGKSARESIAYAGWDLRHQWDLDYGAAGVKAEDRYSKKYAPERLEQIKGLDSYFTSKLVKQALSNAPDEFRDIWYDWTLAQDNARVCFIALSDYRQSIKVASRNDLKLYGVLDGETWCRPTAKIEMEADDHNSFFSSSFTDTWKEVAHDVVGQCPAIENVTLTAITKFEQIPLYSWRTSRQRALGIEPAKTTPAIERLLVLLKSARSGNAASMRELAYVYRDGLGVPRDEDGSNYWFRRSADAGDAHSQGVYAAYLMARDKLRTSLSPTFYQAQDYAWKSREQGNLIGIIVHYILTMPVTTVRGTLDFFKKLHSGGGDPVQAGLEAGAALVAREAEFAVALEACHQEPYVSAPRYIPYCKLAKQTQEFAEEVNKGMGTGGGCNSTFGYSCNANADAHSMWLNNYGWKK